jgi:hypothetical protein
VLRVLDPQNNSSVITPFALYEAMGLLKNVYELGVWDMDTTDTILFLHNLGLEWLAIPSVCGVFRYTRYYKNNLLSDTNSKVYFGRKGYIYVERAVAGQLFDTL